MFVYPADIAQHIRHAARYGIDASIDKVRWSDIRDRIFGRIDPISAGGQEYRVHRSPNVTVYFGHARFEGPKQLAVQRTDVSGTDSITASRIVIAAGSRPVIPAAIGDAGVPYETSDTVMRLDALPEHLVIIGAGYVGAEFAHVFSALGSRVSIVGRSERLLRSQDEAIGTRFTELARRRWDVHLGRKVAGARGTRGDVAVELTDGTSVRGDVLLVATGRVPNGDRLNLPAAGLPTHDDGRIVVDPCQRTPVAGIFAMGDVSSEHQLKHVANHEARVVQHNLLHPDTMIAADHRFVPHAVFSSPQVASVGLTEEEAFDTGVAYVVGQTEYASTAYGWAMGETGDHLVKLLADPSSGLLLGAHLIGPEASSLIQPLIQAMSFGLAGHWLERAASVANGPAEFPRAQRHSRDCTAHWSTPDPAINRLF